MPHQSMPIDSPRMQPWQVFHAANKHLTAETVARCFNREKRSAYAWGQDPAHTECRCKSPLELLHTLFERMDTVGLGYAARAGIEYLSTAIDPDVQVPGIKEPLPTIQEEILADYSAVNRLQQAIEADRGIDAVNRYKREAIAEIERTVAKYSRDHR